MLRTVVSSRFLLATLVWGFVWCGLNSRASTRASAQETVAANAASSEEDTDDVQASELNESFTRLVDDWRRGRLSVERQPQSIRDLIDAVRPIQAADAGKFNGGLTFEDLYRIRQIIDGAHLHVQWKKFADYEVMVEKYQKGLPGKVQDEPSAKDDSQPGVVEGVETLVEDRPMPSLIGPAITAWKKDRLRIKDLPESQREILIEIGRGRIPVPGAKNDGVLMIHLQKLEAELVLEQHRFELIRDLDAAIDRGSPDPRIHYFHSGLILKADRSKSLRSFNKGVELETTAVVMRIVDRDRFLYQTFPTVMAARVSPRSSLLQQEYEDGSRSDEDPLPSSIVSESANRNYEIMSAQEYLVSESLRLINNARTSSNGLVYIRKQLSVWRKPDKSLLKPDLPEDAIESLTPVESAIRSVLLLPHEERLSGIGVTKISNSDTLSSDRELLVTQLIWLMRLALVSRDVTGQRIPFELTRIKVNDTAPPVDNPKIEALNQAAN